MPIRITEIDGGKVDPESNGLSAAYKKQIDTSETPVKEPKTFKVEGTLHLKETEMLENICREISDKTGRPLIIELSNICSLDHASAQVLCRMRRQQGIQIRGMNLFVRKVMELTNETDGEDRI